MKNLRLQIPYQVASRFGYDAVGDNGNEELIYYCPYCINRKGTPDRKGKLYVNIKTLKFHCFRCGASGVISKKHIDTNKSYEEDKDDIDNLNLIKSVNKLFDDSEEFSVKIPINKVFENSTAVKYLLDRGFTYEQMKYYDLRVGNLHNEFGRIIIPNQVSKEVYTDFYTARSFINQVPKYHNSKGINKSEIVFNLHRIKENDTIILVEGPLTAIAAGYHAVASLGKTLSYKQASMILQKKPKRIYVNYDYGAEKESHEACKLLYLLAPETPIYEVLMPDDRDAADLSKEEYVDRLSKGRCYLPEVEDILEVLNE